MAAELGAIGVALYVWLLVGGVRLIEPVRRREQALGLALAASFLALFVHALFYSGFLEDPITWLVLAVARRLARRGTTPQRPRAPSAPRERAVARPRERRRPLDPRRGVGADRGAVRHRGDHAARAGLGPVALPARRRSTAVRAARPARAGGGREVGRRASRARACFLAALLCGAAAMLLIARPRAWSKRARGRAACSPWRCCSPRPRRCCSSGLRDSTAPWFFTNDSTYQIEQGGDLLLHLDNPYGHDYRHSGLERFYTRDGSVSERVREREVALRHFAYFPGTVVRRGGLAAAARARSTTTGC